MNYRKLSDDWKVLIMAASVTGFLVALWSLKRTITDMVRHKKRPFSKRYITLVSQITKEE